MKERGRPSRVLASRYRVVGGRRRCERSVRTAHITGFCLLLAARRGLRPGGGAKLAQPASRFSGPSQRLASGWSCRRGTGGADPAPQLPALPAVQVPPHSSEFGGPIPPLCPRCRCRPRPRGLRTRRSPPRSSRRDAP
ncbi:hypothetical protein DT019_21265 [Streptomyces sp. SDr-06]|nr:hypothetical protein DT019_21265 [Streptomyces sp. SDr-06]